MEILLVKKSTNLDILEESIRLAVDKGLISEDELLDLEEEHRQHLACLTELKAELHKHEISFSEVGRDEDLPDRDFDFVLSHGGDGTLLTAGQFFDKGARIIGICSTDNSVGHLCGVQRHEVKKLVESMVAGTIELSPVARMQARIERIDGSIDITPPVINDILYTHAHPAGMSRYRLYHGDIHEEQRSSGIWFSTAVGSTAAAKAAGGANLDFLSADFQYVVRERYNRNDRPGSAHAQLNHGVFQPETNQVTLFNRSAQAILALDGQRCSVELGYGDKITMERAPGIELLLSLPT